MPGVPSKSALTTAPPGMLFQVPLVLDAPVDDQPGTRNARLITLRPCIGRFVTCFVSIVVERVLDVGSTNGEAPFTCTVCVECPTVSVARTAVTRPVCTSTGSNIVLSNPGLPAVSRYLPNGSA